MKIDIISDLHLKEKGEIEAVKGAGEIIVVAGDISNNIEIVASYLNFLSKNYKAVLFTLGNIELWHKNPANQIETLKNSVNKNVYLLNFLRCIKINGKRIVGGLYFSRNFLTPNDKEKIANGDNSFLTKLENTSRINLHKKIKTFNPQIVITHYPPVSTRNIKKLNTTKIDNFNRIWIFGHYHQFTNFFGKDEFNKDTLYICNCSKKPLSIEF
ncbi:metallophosphoesterase family protein [Desulfurobacterium atlanticum]|uniref:Predicted phosphohydrolase n=1 Tax=Desulfurobacterium atlanticum TaxID=240169 RepID=A0A238YUU3_9BACT|nr:metallophosphoesterase [Desulfurobacterium atlanticum]SNR74905.1 Predicted phosphohydrolase [Desulfurobacterium atlanticum]